MTALTTARRNWNPDEFHASTRCDLGKPVPQCVQVAHKDGLVAIRDSKDGSILEFDANEWKTFIEGAKSGEFDFGLV